MSEALGQQLGQVTAQMLAKNLNIAPTLEIRPGYRFNVIVTRDMNFSKLYRSFEVCPGAYRWAVKPTRNAPLPR